MTLESLYQRLSINPYVGSAVLLITACFLAWQLWSKRPENSPPGTNGIPLIGVILSIRANHERILQKWAERYGPLYLVKFGFTDVVVISTYEVAQEAFAKNACFNDKPKSLPIFDGNGFLMNNFSDFFKEQRRFGLHTLREFGMGRRSLEPRIVELANNLCDKIANLCEDNSSSKPFDIVPYLYELSSSIISYIVFGYNVAKENKKLDKLLKDMTAPNKLNVLAGVMVFVPFLRHFPFFSNVWKRSENFREGLSVEMKKEILKHQSSHDPNHPRDYIDSFITKMKKREAQSEKNNHNNNNPLKDTLKYKDKRSVSCSSSSDEDEDLNEYGNDWVPLSSFTTDQILASVRDLFIAGTDTTSTSLTWLILYLCLYPDVQRKFQEEIDKVLGENGVPSMALMEKLPYIRAVVQEVTRIRPVIPLSVPHTTSRESTLLGYRIPKNAIILTNIWAVHHNEKFWPEPDKFKPERHLDEDGKFVSLPNWMMFGVGARSCLGQQLAKMELCLTSITLFRRFNVSLASNKPPNMNGESMVSLRPFTELLLASIR